MRLIRVRCSVSRLTVAALMALGSTAALAQPPDKPAPSAKDFAAMQAAAVRLQQLDTVAANRPGVIAALVGQWQGTARANGFDAGWAKDFQAELTLATDGQLVDLQAATSYDAVRAILQGRTSPATLADQSTIQDLGNISSDLTFTPVNPPCRIFDTRNYGGGVAPGPGTYRHYYVAGSGATMSAQGGNAAGCPAPGGEPVGIAGNFTAVPLATGHLRIFPYGGSLPTVSFLNFTNGVNIANAGILSTCYLCGPDLTVYNAAQTHHVGDVMGYFYPAKQAVPGLSQSSGTTYLDSSTCNNYSGGTVTITTPGAGYVTVTAQAMMGMDGGAARYAYVYLGVNSTDCTFADFGGGYQSGRTSANTTVTSYQTVPVSRTFFVSGPGTYTYYLNGNSSEPSGSFNVYFWYGAMQAIYNAR